MSKDSDNQEVFADNKQIIDLVGPDGRGMYSRKTLSELQVEHPAAGLWDMWTWQLWASQIQKAVTLIWVPCSQEAYDDALGAVPPLYYGRKGSFLVGEPMDHCHLTGEPRQEGFVISEGSYYTTSRVCTQAEFLELLGVRHER